MTIPPERPVVIQPDPWPKRLSMLVIALLAVVVLLVISQVFTAIAMNDTSNKLDVAKTNVETAIRKADEAIAGQREARDRQSCLVEVQGRAWNAVFRSLRDLDDASESGSIAGGILTQRTREVIDQLEATYRQINEVCPINPDGPEPQYDQIGEPVP